MELVGISSNLAVKAWRLLKADPVNGNQNDHASRLAVAGLPPSVRAQPGHYRTGLGGTRPSLESTDPSQENDHAESSAKRDDVGATLYLCALLFPQLRRHVPRPRVHG